VCGVHPTTAHAPSRPRITSALAAAVVSAVAVTLLGAAAPPSHPAASASAAEPVADVRARRPAVRAPRARIGEVLAPSVTNRYRFKGRKGQRVILMPDGWPNAGHWCFDNASLRIGGTSVAKGAIGEWRLPLTGTYLLRVGDSCVDRLQLRMRRYQQPTREVGDDLPTRFTRTLMRSAVVRLPVGRPVVLEQVESGAGVHVTAVAPGRSPFIGCSVHVVTAGTRRSCGPGRVSRLALVSAPTRSSVRLAQVVAARVDGPPVEVADPGTTLVRVDVPAPTAVRVEGAAVPHAVLGARPWVSLYSTTGAWYGSDLTAFEVENPDRTRLPSGWTVEKAGGYLFQLNRHLVGDGPQAFAVRTSANPPPGASRW